MVAATHSVTTSGLSLVTHSITCPLQTHNTRTESTLRLHSCKKKKKAKQNLTVQAAQV